MFSLYESVYIIKIVTRVLFLICKSIYFKLYKMASSTATNSKYLDYAGLSHLKTVLDGRYVNKSDTLPYLPLSGGALTGPLVFNGSDTDRNVIRINCTSGDASKIGEWGYTLKFLGSGSGVNNSLALYADNSEATTQNLATKWLNDGTMYGRSILPHTNNTFDLGSSSLKWKNVYSTTFTGNLTGDVTGNATSSTKTGDGTNILYAEKQNEINFGGTSNSATIYFGYRATDSKPIPSKFVFGSTTGTAELLAKTYKKTDGTEVSYNGHTHTFLNSGGSQLSATTRNLTSFPISKTLFTGYWGSETDTLGYNTRYGTTLDISYSTWYQRLAFDTSITNGKQRIEYFSGINTNNTSGTEATLTKIGDLAYLSDIPTKVSQLTNDAGYTTANGHTHSYVDSAGTASHAAVADYATYAYYIATSNVVTTETINTLTDEEAEVVPVIPTGQIVISDSLRQFWVNVRNIIEDNEFVCASALTDLNTRLNNINASINLSLPVSTTTKYNILGSPSTSGELNTAYCSSSVYMQGNNLYATSDERLKNFKEDIEVDLEKLRKLPKKYFTWKGENMIDIGTSAQELLKLYPELVSYDSVNDIYAVDYVKLSVIALAAVDTLYDRLKSTEDRLKVIEDKLAKLS